MSERRLSYTFGPLERSGLLGGFGAGQALVLAGAAVAAVAALDAAPSLAGLLVAICTVTVALVLALAPAGGGPLCEWLPIGLAFIWRGRRVGRSEAPERGVIAGPSLMPRRAHAGPVPPRELRGVELIDVRYRDRSVGVLSEDGGRLVTTVLACRAGSFAMLDAEAQERRLARWGQILSAAASSQVRRLQWVERTAPSQGDELARYLHGERDPSVPLRGTPLIDSYLELIDSTARVGQEHEILLALQVDGRRGGEQARETLIAESERLARSLEAAEVSVLGALSAAQLARTLRTAFDPYARAELTALETTDPDREQADSSLAWPLAVREEWDRYAADGAEHATWWVSGWPRVAVSPMFMETVLARSPAVRTFAVTFEPIPPGRSTREVEAQITRDRADAELRRRFGQSETARQRQARDANARREGELAQGHGEVRLAGFVTVSGRDSGELRAACAEVVEHAARARLELRRLYGRQAEAFTFTLPLCRGLR